MSRYVRDDKQFRAHIANLADAGLHLAQPGSPAHAKAQYTPEFQRQLDRINNAKTHSEVAAGVEGALDQIRAEYNMPKMPKRSRLAEFAAGIVWWSPVIAGVVVFLHWLIVRGAH